MGILSYCSKPVGIFRPWAQTNVNHKLIISLAKILLRWMSYAAARFPARGAYLLFLVFL